MIKHIRALNESSSDEVDSEDSGGESVNSKESRHGGKGEIKLTREAEEALVREKYQKALLKLANEEKKEAKAQFEELLDGRLLKEIHERPESSKDNALAPVYYAICKNLGGMLADEKKHAEALDLFIKATEVDDTEALMWYKLGIQAFKIENYYTARIGLERCLELSPDFWPCLDNLVSLTYIVTDYCGCLSYIEQCLAKKEDYVRGLAVKDEIFRNPYMKERYKDRFAKYENRTYDMERAREIMDQLNVYVDKKAEKNEALFKPLETISPDFDLEDFSVIGIGRAIQTFSAQVIKNVKAANPVDLSRWVNNVKSAAQPMDTTECAVPEESAAAEKALEATEGQVSRMENGEECHQQETVIPMDTTMETSVCDSDTEAGRVENSDQPNTPNDASTPCDQEDSHQSSPVLSCNSPILPTAPYRRGGWKRKRGGGIRGGSGGHSVFKRRSTRLIPGFHMDDPEAFGPLTTKPVSLSEHLRSYMPMIFARHGDTEQEAQTSESDVCKASTAEEVHHSAPLFDDIFTKEDALAFLESHAKTNSTMRLLWDFMDWLQQLASCKYRWSDPFRQVFIDCYDCLMSTYCQLSKPHVFETDEQLKKALNEQCRQESQVHLLYAEFKGWKGTDDELKNVVRLHDHLAYVSNHRMVFDDDLEEWGKFWVRVEWMYANVQERRKKYGGADLCLSLCLSMIENELDGRSIPLEHCDAIISTSSLKRRMEHIERTELLDQIEDIFAQREYQSAMDILTTHLFTSKADEEIGMDRLRQYEIFLICCRALEKTRDIPTAFVRALRFSIILYGRIDVEEKKKWWITMGKILSIGERAFFGQNTGPSVDSLNTAQRYVLASSLIDIIMLADESPLKKEEMPNWCWMSPWNILYQLSRYLEMQQFDQAYAKAWYEKANSSTVILATRSLMIFWKCHEELGRRRLCMIRDGMFLTYLAEEILQTLRHPVVSQCISSSCLNDTLNFAEQCFYCLYKYPTKKKRHLEEHDATPVELDWSKALLLFDFVKPDQAPEFDDHPNATAMSTDSVQLIHKIEGMVPTGLRPDPLARKVDDFFDNTAINEYPQMLLEDEPIISELYHLLADFYLKTQDFEKAVKYYQYDLCISGDRFDSWAGLAMARGALLDRRLRSMELKYDSDAQAVVAREAKAALYCYRRATEIKKTHYVLLLEYGTLAYVSHSFFSRALKHGGLKLEENEKKRLIKLRNIYLSKAENALISADSAAKDPNVVQEEEWMHNYMLGKIAEKRKAAHHEDPTVSLARYHAANCHLEQDGARYPERIKYNSPQRYALETLEVFYRVHACTLKWLLRGNVTEAMIKKVYRFVAMFRGSPIYDCKKDVKFPSAARLFCDLEVVDVVDSLLDKTTGDVGQKSGGDSQMDVTNDDLPSTSSSVIVSQMRKELVKWCSEAFQLCIRRFSNHFKSHYWLAKIYFGLDEFKDYHKSRQILLGPISIPDFHVHAGLFQHRKPSNFFEGIWCIPMDDINRAGSFSEHMFRALKLMCQVLEAVQDYHSLGELLIALYRKPAVDKHKYLREPDRQELLEVASAAVERTFVKVFKKDPDESLVAIYRFHLQLYKMQLSDRTRWVKLLKVLLTKKTKEDFMRLDDQFALTVCAALEKKVNAMKAREIASPRKSTGGLPEVQAVFQRPAPISVSERRSTNEGNEASYVRTVPNLPKVQSVAKSADGKAGPAKSVSSTVMTSARPTVPQGRPITTTPVSSKTTAVRPFAPLDLGPTRTVPTTTSATAQVTNVKPLSTDFSTPSGPRRQAQLATQPSHHRPAPTLSQRPSTSRPSIPSESSFAPSHSSTPRQATVRISSYGTAPTTDSGPSSATSTTQSMSSLSSPFSNPFNDMASPMMMPPEHAFLAAAAAAYFSQQMGAPPNFYDQLMNPFAQGQQLAQFAQQLSMAAPTREQGLTGLRLPTVTETSRSGVPSTAAQQQPQMRRSLLEERAEQARNAGTRMPGSSNRGTRHRYSPYGRFKNHNLDNN